MTGTAAGHERSAPRVRLHRRAATGRDRLAAAAAVAAVVVVVVMLGSRHPATLSFMPSCPVKAGLGLECPGCGSGRAVHHALNGDLSAAFRHNPAMLLLGAPLLGLLAADLLGTLLLGRRSVLRLGRRAGFGLAVILVAYMIARNVPVDWLEFLRPPALPSQPRAG